MKTPTAKNPLFFILPVATVIIGVVFLLSPSLFPQLGSSASGQGVYTYYEQTLTPEALKELSNEKQVYEVIYAQPIDGSLGSVWDSPEEAQQAENDYRAQYGQAHDIIGTDRINTNTNTGAGSTPEPVPGDGIERPIDPNRDGGSAGEQSGAISQ